MRVISGSLVTGLPTRRFHVELIARSSGVGFTCHYSDSFLGSNVTDGDTRLVGSALRGQTSPSAKGKIAQLAKPPL